MKNNFLKNKVVLVTGGCGSIGSELVKQILKSSPKEVRVLDNWETGIFYLKGMENMDPFKVKTILGDIKDKERVNSALKGVDIVFHAAAKKHVPICEHNPFEAVSTNVIGAENLVSAAIQNNIKIFVGISTDKAVNPVNTMGATKLLAERIITSKHFTNSKTIFCCVRFGNVLNSVGSVIPIFEKQIKKGGPVTITSDQMTRFFMSISEAVKLTIKAASLMEGGKIFILKMNALKIVDLAKVLINELAPKYGYDPKKIKMKNIGIRPGEKLHEELVTKEELPLVEDRGDMFALKSSLYPVGKIKKKAVVYGSENIPKLNPSQIKKLLYDKGIIKK